MLSIHYLDWPRFLSVIKLSKEVSMKAECTPPMELMSLFYPRNLSTSFPVTSIPGRSSDESNIQVLPVGIPQPMLINLRALQFTFIATPQGKSFLRSTSPPKGSVVLFSNLALEKEKKFQISLRGQG